MKETIKEMRRAWLPYVMNEYDIGRWGLLNRMYRPLGFSPYRQDTFANLDAPEYLINMTDKFFDILTEYPGVPSKKLVRVTESGLRSIWLYDEGCLPFSGTARYTAAYLKKLSALETAFEGTTRSPPLLDIPDFHETPKRKLRLVKP